MTAPTVRSFGPYELVSPLGAGGMGQVYRARDSRLGRYVAVKVLPPAFSTDPERLRRFEQEAKAAAALNHPNIVAVFDVGTTEDGAPFIVTELLEGSTLGHRIRNERLPVRSVIDYALQIVRALAAAHERGIIHRDLKPENIFVTRDGVVKILDFGLAKLMDVPKAKPDEKTATFTPAGTLPGVIMGTVGYMSPEQVRGLPVDHRTDIFAFGTILYEMLACKPAFRAATDADTQASILREDPPPLSATNASIPRPLEQIVWHCIEKEPQHRFQSASDIGFNLQAISATSSLSGFAVNAPLLLKSRRRLLAIVAILGALALAVMASLAYQSLVPPPSPKYQQLTYQEGVVASARFLPDGQTVICAARFNQGNQVYSIRLDSFGLRSLGIEANQILSVSSKGEVAVLESARRLVGATQVGALARIPLGGGAAKTILNDVQAADWSPDGAALAISHFIPDKHVYRLEYPIGKVLYETAGWIGQLRLSPDGRFIAFTDHPTFGDGQGYVAVIPAEGGNVQHVTRSWGDLQGLAWHPDGDVWYTATDFGFNYSLYAATRAGKNHHVLAVPGGLILNDIASSGRVLVNHFIERTVIMVSTQKNREELNLSWLDNTEFFRFSNDGQQLLMGDESDISGSRHASFLRNVDGSPAVKVGDGDGIALSPDGEWVLSRIPPDQLVLLPTGAGEPRRLVDPSLTSNTSHSSQPAIRADLPADWFPDSKRFAYIADDHRTHLLDLDGHDVALTPEGTTGYLVTPDGQHVLVRSGGGTFDLFPVSAGVTVPLPFLLADDSPVRFTADGKDVYVKTRENGGLSVYRVNLSTGHRTLFRHFHAARGNLANDVGTVDVTPDGTGYAYGFRQSSSALYVVDGLK